MAGIVGVWSNDNSSREAYYALFETQHRGQENVGISGLGNHSFRTYINKGMMSRVFDQSLINAFIHPTDYVSVGHVGNTKQHRKNIAPFGVESEKYEISVSMDGFIMNPDEINSYHKINTETNEELFGKMVLEKTENYSDIVDSVASVMEELDRAYFSFVLGVHDKKRQKSMLLGGRDKRGVKPMYMARTDDGLYISSESGAADTFESIGKFFVERRDVAPGEIVFFDGDFHSEKVLTPKRSHDAFEWVYSSRPDAVMEGVNAHSVRKKLGQSIVKRYEIEDDGISVVSPTPDSGRSVALGISEASGIPFDEAIIKNQYIGRTYIIPDPKVRSLAAMLKHNVIKDVVKGKRVVIGDDSIVRGTISEALSAAIKNSGAKKVEIAVSYAPIFYSCFNEPGDKKLAARGQEGRKVTEINEYVARNLPSIDKVYYNTPEDVIKSIGLPSQELCTYCITGKDPFSQ